MFYSINRKIIVAVIALFTLLFSNGKIANAVENITPKYFSLSNQNHNNFNSENYSHYQKEEKVAIVKIPRVRRKYFREERIVSIIDFGNISLPYYFTASDSITNNTDCFSQTSLSLSLLRGPPIV